MRRKAFLNWSLLSATAFGLALVADSEPARAEWPPPDGATAQDMADPANWPNDPGYGYQAGASKSDRRNGLWQYYSFVPERSPNTMPLRSEETASGMSVDLAWRHTIGRDDVLIAVVDSGIKWDERDLIEKAHLNLAELASHKPLDALGQPCGGTGAIEGFDCNGDGIVTVGDWADHPTLLPEATDGRPKGDQNENGVLDAGDLIVNFSDCIDDDGNGFVDDISGWDFMKDDNNPYDDTRYGHGTGEAKDSAAQGNNGISEIGVCPLCRYIPMRVGDSFIVDAQKYAQAVIYATDNDAHVIQEALGTVNMSRFAQKAMDYAWANGLLVVASMADENSRHHNMPATANHTMPVHAITMLGHVGQGRESTTAESFLHFNTCTNYGAQNFLSASGDACSSEAVGRTAGIAGLMYSAAKDIGLDMRPGEAMQILFASADDIDIPESREAGSRHFWSQPGFDQRFGYGRINVNRAVEHILEERIPPDIDIVKPYWFEVLYEDQVTAPVPINGSIFTRAPAFSYQVEWAPGVQPLDSDFEVLTKMENVPGNGTFGGDGTPLGEIDIRGLDVSHERDADSPRGENDRTITVRIRATAHYGGDKGDVRGELRRAYAVHSDPDLLPGFPIYLGASGEASPKTADIDGDGVRDLIVPTSDGRVNVFKLTGPEPEQLPGFPAFVKHLDGLDGDPSRTDYRSAPAFSNPSSGIDVDDAREAIVSAPAIADIDGDDRLEIVVTTWEGTITAFNHDGSVVDGWPVRLPEVRSCPRGDVAVCAGNGNGIVPGPDELCMDTVTRVTRGAFGAPVLEDMDKDGDLEIIQAGFDGKLHIFQADGSPLAGWPVTVHYTGDANNQGAEEINRIFTTPAVADFNGDGIPEVLTGSNERINDSGNFFLVDGRGTALSEEPWLENWPVRMASFNIFPVIAEGVTNSPIVADLEGDGEPEAIMHGNGSAPLIVPADPGFRQRQSDQPPNRKPDRINRSTGEPAQGVEPTGIFGPDSEAVLPDSMFPLFAQPSAGDLNQDGIVDVVATGGSLSMTTELLSPSANSDRPAQQLLSMWDGKTGQMMPASPIVLEDFTFLTSQAIADLSGDGYPEVITGTGAYFVHGVDACGRQPEGWPKFVGGWVVATPTVGDVTGDGNLEVAVNTREGWLFAWKTKGTSDGVIPWESFHHDNRNTGNLSVPLEQGTLLGADEPLPVDEDGSCILPETGDAGPDAGNAGAGGGGPDDPGAQTDGLDPSGGGCGCTVPQRRSTSPAWLLLLGPLGLWLRRRSLP